MDFRKTVVMGAGLLLWVAAASGGDWPQFRGPGGDGVLEEARLPTEWGQEKNIQWKIKPPGVAWSCPVVFGDRIYLTTAESENQPKPSAGQSYRGPGAPGGPEGKGQGRAERPKRERSKDGPDDKKDEKGDRPRRGGPGGFGRGNREAPQAVYRWKVLCLDKATGKTLWTKLADEHRPSIPTHRTNTYASETPIVDGERIYAYFGMTGLFCYDLEGKLLWKKSLGSYPMANGWGTGSSPVLVGDLIIVQCDNEEKSFIVAFDKKTGEEKWRDDRDERSTWSTPFVWKNKQRTELVTGGSKKVRSYDPATGKILWELGGVSGRSASTAVGDEEMVYLGTGGGMGVGPLFAIKAGASGALTLDEAAKSGQVAWVSPRGGPPMASPLLYKGYLYVLDQRGGILTCYEAKTGKVAYKERIAGATGFTASPWAAGGKIFCADGEGTTFVLEAGPTYKLLAKNPLGEMCWSTPALADGKIYLRTIDHLYCIQQ
jgi:outer membrane protein assembly factor BamB